MEERPSEQKKKEKRIKMKIENKNFLRRIKIIERKNKSDESKGNRKKKIVANTKKERN